MKKQLFSFVMLLALVVFAGTRVNAQGVGDGMKPSSAYFAIVGSTTVHGITADGSTTAWSILTVSDQDANVGETGAAAPGASYAIIAGGGAGDVSISVRWRATAGAGNLFAVQVIETSDDAQCTTIRRFYIGVFDFTVDVLLANNITGGGADANAAFNKSNTWCGTVAQNTLSQTILQNEHQDSINNPTDNLNKETSTFFRVTIALTGAPASFTLANMKWRFQYSLQNTANVALFDITSADGALFTGEAGTATIGGAPEASLDPTAGTNEMVYVPVAAGTSAQYDFEIGNHNMLGAPAQAYSIRIDAVDIEFGATTDYNNGSKYHADYITEQSLTNVVALTDGETGLQTIYQGPATTTITIAD